MGVERAKAHSKRETGDGGVRGGLLEGYHRGGEYPLQGARVGRRSVRSAVKARLTPNHARKCDGVGHRTKRGCFRKSFEWHLLVVRISEAFSSNFIQKMKMRGQLP